MLSLDCRFAQISVLLCASVMLCGLLACSFVEAGSAEESAEFSSDETESSVCIETERRLIEKSDGRTVESILSKTLDQHGNVVAYNDVMEENGSPYLEWEPTQDTLTYDSIGIAVSCDGTDCWTQEVTKWTSDNLPQVVRRTRADGSQTEFSFDYYPNGQIQSYSITSPVTESEYEFDEDKHLVHWEDVDVYDGGTKSDPSVSSWQYFAESDGTLRVVRNRDGEESTVSYVCDEKGLPISGAEILETSTCDTLFSYQCVDDPSPMARFWSGYIMGSFDSLNPLSNPTY